MVDVAKYLDQDVDAIEAPKALAPGHYFANVKNWSAIEAKSEKKTPMVKVDFTITGADEDVEADAGPEKVAGKMVSTNFNLDQDFGRYALRKFMEDALALPVKGLTLGEALPQTLGQPCKLYIEHRTLPDGRVVEDVKKTLAA
jgi:hypothetical protein